MPITHTFSAYRLKKTGNTEEYDGTPTYTGIDCLVSPASVDILAVYPNIPAYQLYEIHTQENYVLKNSDKLTDGVDEYIVKDVPVRVENNYMTYTRIVGLKKV